MHAHPGGVGGLGVVLQHAGHAEVRHLAHQVAVDQDVPGGQVAVDVAHVGEVLHARRDSPQDAHQLDHRETTVVLLQRSDRCCEERCAHSPALHFSG